MLTAIVITGSGLVYISLALQSAYVFAVGEVICLLAAIAILWVDRGQLRQWWNERQR